VPKLCKAIGAAALASPIPGFDEAVVGASCGALITALFLICDFNTLKCGAADIFDWLDLTNSDLFVYPVVTTDSDGAVLKEKEVPENGPVPFFEVSFTGTVSIQNLNIEPADPDPGEDYVATTRIYCPTSGTDITFSIVGTDGYEDSKTVTLEGSSLINLNVPSATEGVKDVITVDVLNGPTMSTSIVF
jgi:hypothetical protein